MLDGLVIKLNNMFVCILLKLKRYGYKPKNTKILPKKTSIPIEIQKSGCLYIAKPIGILIENNK